MAVVHVVVCARCGDTFWAGRARSDWSARARAAAHRWVTEESHGVTDDVCPACVTAAIPVVQAAARAAVAHAAPASAPPAMRSATTTLPRAASAAAAVPTQPGEVSVFEAGLELCHWCEEGQHHCCTGCECACRW